MEIPVQLGGICKAHSKLTLPFPQRHKKPLIDNGIDGSLSCREERLHDGIDESADRLAVSCRPYRYEWTLNPTWLETNQYTVGDQVLPRSPEGMDHALDCDSSK